MRQLDRLDRQILNILQNDGRIAMTELADRVHLSPTPCSDRVKRMERDGVILGYHARVNPHAVGRNLLVFLEIKLSAKSGDVFDRVKEALRVVPEVLECHLVSGEFDYLVKARLSEMNAYRRLLGDILKRLPAAASSHSYVVMEEVKESTFLDMVD
ncbi:MAG: winged helix-turn-helix transcriptional regulator [Burkholderiaceae bacterium]|nr:winged helix-turn-helix transcriptional regulator [Burkholderiaceae bacterium]